MDEEKLQAYFLMLQKNKKNIFTGKKRTDGNAKQYFLNMVLEYLTHLTSASSHCGKIEKSLHIFHIKNKVWFEKKIIELVHLTCILHTNGLSLRYQH